MNQMNAAQAIYPSCFESFGKYLLLKRLAAGGMAEVFLARPASQEGNGRVLVIKRILPHVASNSDFRQMFQTEIQVIMGFNHPHTVQLHDFGHFNQQPYIAMEFIEGKNLKELMNKLVLAQMKMPVPAALGLVMQAAAGLNYAHSFVNKVTGEVVNAIHRDISPHNLLLSYDGNLKVIDFGIAKAAISIGEQTQAGILKGKTAYLSPEQIKGKPIDARSDIFAIGVVAWELLTLSRPFSTDSDSELTIVGKICEADRHIRPPSEFNPEVTADLDQVILKALRQNPDERYSTAGEFQKALREVMLKHYPTHSYSDTSKLIHSLFEQEIVKERQEIQYLNKQAQMDLTPSVNGKTMITAVDGNDPAPKKTQPLSFDIQKSEMSQVDVRLSQIETMMKQKAQQKHYLLFVFYVVSMIAMKMDDSFKLLFESMTGNKIVEQFNIDTESNVKPNSPRSKQDKQNSKPRKKQSSLSTGSSPAEVVKN